MSEVRLIDAEELKCRIQSEVVKARAERTLVTGIDRSGDAYISCEAVMCMIDRCPTRNPEHDDAYIPCEHGDLACGSCKYHDPEEGCMRDGGRTEHDWRY